MTLSELQQAKELIQRAIKSHDDLSLAQLVKRLDQYKEPAVERVIAEALLNLALCYGAQGLPEQEMAQYRILIERFQDSTDENLQQEVAQALLNLAVSYEAQGLPEQEMAQYRILIERFQDSTDETLQHQVAHALFMMYRNL